MSDKENWKPVASLKTLQRRAQLLQDIRAFFFSKNVLEVETPILTSAAVSDVHIKSFETNSQKNKYYLNTSPEYCMKRLLAEYDVSIFQICKVFRNDELGPVHNPEFTMLEWYRPGFGMTEMMSEVEELLQTLMQTELGNIEIVKITYQHAFEKQTGINPHKTTVEECLAYAHKSGLEQPVGLGELDGWLDWILTQSVLQEFENKQFTILYDYPVTQSALAKVCVNSDGTPVAKRFELFFGEIELANGFYELTDAVEQRSRFEDDNRKRSLAGLKKINLDERFLSALYKGLPECSGVAIGIDRLLMLPTGLKNIADTVAFPWAVT